MFPLLQNSVYIVCRCCLLEQPRLCHNICENYQLNDELLSLAPNLQILPDDVICDQCLHCLHSALDFRQRCEHSERILRARHEQALDDALECLEREVGSLEKVETIPMLTLMEPVDFGK